MANTQNRDEAIESILFKAADKLRKNIDAEYKHCEFSLGNLI